MVVLSRGSRCVELFDADDDESPDVRLGHLLYFTMTDYHSSKGLI
jgi:hypothetical protein